jgi:hypothetical protein
MQVYDSYFACLPFGMGQRLDGEAARHNVQNKGQVYKSSLARMESGL